MSLFYLGTGHYLCRGEGKKEGEAKLSYKEVWGGQQFDREVYFKTGPLAKIGSAKLYNFKLFYANPIAFCIFKAPLFCTT